MQIWKRFTRKSSHNVFGNLEDEVEMNASGDGDSLSSVERGQSPHRTDSSMELLGRGARTVGKPSGSKTKRGRTKGGTMMADSIDQTFWQIVDGVWENSKCYFVDPQYKMEAYKLLIGNLEERILFIHLKNNSIYVPKNNFRVKTLKRN